MTLQLPPTLKVHEVFPRVADWFLFFFFFFYYFVSLDSEGFETLRCVIYSSFNQEFIQHLDYREKVERRANRYDRR